MAADPPTIRPAGAADAAAIAALHVESWRATYRGSLSDAYLDGPIEAERRDFWRTRLGHPPQGLVTLLAEDAAGLSRGFVCALVDHDARWGTLIDNLHVAPGLKGGGLGRRLMLTLGETLQAMEAACPVHLFVLAANAAAAGFYARLGGSAVERMVKTEPDGTSLHVDRIAWPSLAAFIEGARGPGRS